MPKVEYVTKRFNAASESRIVDANEIISEFAELGFSLTLRQLYYQFVARGKIENSQKSYKQLGELISNARLAGLIDWRAIEDRTRSVRGRNHWDCPAGIVDAAAGWYGRALWVDQDYRPQVWIEKDALVGVIEGVCVEFDVPYFSCRGYTSQSALWRAAQVMRGLPFGQTPVVIHLGDHDPSGMDMTRDITERLKLFCGQAVAVERIALNYDQIKQYNPPANPAKLTDSRAGGYISKFGSDSWELDALNPTVIAALIRAEIEGYISDREAWEAEIATVDSHKEELAMLANNYDLAIDAIREDRGRQNRDE